MYDTLNHVCGRLTDFAKLLQKQPRALSYQQDFYFTRGKSATQAQLTFPVKLIRYQASWEFPQLAFWVR